MAILYGFAARCLFGVVFLHKAKQGRWLCAVSTRKFLPHQRTAPCRFTTKPSNTSGMVSLLSLPLITGIAMYFFVGIFFERSGNSMTTCCVVNGNMALGEPGSQYCITKYGSSYPQIVCWLHVSGVWNYPNGWAYLKCTRSPRNT